jgi:hypothetical protein
MASTSEPESDDMEVGVDINETVQSNLTPSEGIAQRTKHSLRPSIGRTNGIAFIETVPLVFPALDTLAGNNSQEAKAKREKLKHEANFTDEYFDRRAQAKYVCGLYSSCSHSFNSFSSFPYFEVHVVADVLTL